MQQQSNDDKAGCPRCGEAADLDDLAARLRRSELARERGRGRAQNLEHHCRRCRTRYTVPLQRVASHAIKRQTQEVFSSISRVLRIRSRLQ